MIKNIILTCLMALSLTSLLCEGKSKVPFQDLIKSTKNVLLGTVADVTQVIVEHNNKQVSLFTYSYYKVKPLNSDDQAEQKQSFSFMSENIIPARAGDRHLVLVLEPKIIGGIKTYPSEAVFRIDDDQATKVKFAVNSRNNTNLWPGGHWESVEQKIEFMKSSSLGRSYKETELVWDIARKQPSKGAIPLKYLVHYINYFTGNIIYTRTMFDPAPVYRTPS